MGSVKVPKPPVPRATLWKFLSKTSILLLWKSVAYRKGSDPTLPAGYVHWDLRLARYDGALWSTFSEVAERNSSAPVRTPTAGNSPQVGIDATGLGIVACQA